MRFDRVTGDRFQRRLLCPCIAGRWCCKSIEHLADTLRILRRLIRGDPTRVVGEPEERSSLGAEAGDLKHDAAVVELVAAATAGSGCRHDPLTNVASNEAREERVTGEQDEGDEPLAVEPAFPCGFCRRRDLARSKPIKLRDIVDDNGELVRVGEQVFLELRRQTRESLIEVSQASLLIIAETSAGNGELGVVALQEVARLSIQFELIDPLVKLIDTPEERRIELDRIGVPGEDRGEGFFKFVGERRRVGGGLVVEDRRHPVKQLTTALQRHDGVVEGGHRSPHGDRGHLAQLLGHACVERLAVVLVADLGKRRHPERQGRRGEEWVAHDESLGWTDDRGTLHTWPSRERAALARLAHH